MSENLVFGSDVKPLQPSQVIFSILDEAQRRTDTDPKGEFGIIDGHVWHHQDLAVRIDEYVGRLLKESKGSGV